METVGNVPSLRYEVTVAGASALYPLSETPVPVPGREFVQVGYNGRGQYDERNRPYLDFQKDIVQGGGRAGAFVTDDRGFANVIRGRAQPRAPDTELGHFHLDYAEFWFVMEGKIDYLIEGLPFFTADQGDIVYVPRGRYHRASFGGEGTATRLAINGYPQGLHNYQAPADR
jgi:mannose-6-phosphate isomerase-like protein (cupin superfamily)